MKEIPDKYWKRRIRRIRETHSLLVLILSLSIIFYPVFATANLRTSPVPQRDSLQSVLARAGSSTTGTGLWAGHGSVGSAASDTPRVETGIPRILRVLLNYAPESVASSPLPNQRDAVTSSADPLSSVSQTPVSIVSSFDGLSQIQDSCKCVPPDVQVATGPNHVVEMVNTQGEFFTKQGHSIQNFTLSLFFNTGSDFLSDPKVMYDASSGRWFASIIDIVGLNFVTLAYSSVNVKVAVSLSSDPTVTNPSTSTWNIYTLQFGKTLPDQPILGVSDDKLVISTNGQRSHERWELHLWTPCRSHLSPSSSISQLDKYRIHGQHRLLLDIPELCRALQHNRNPGSLEGNSLERTQPHDLSNWDFSKWSWRLRSVHMWASKLSTPRRSRAR